jgi:uncharacterized membrane protein
MLTKTDIEKYFTAEKSESLLFLIIGIIAILLSVAFFFFLKGAIYKGAAWPLILIGLIQVVVGTTVYTRSDQQRIDIVYKYDMNPAELKTNELPRMQAVNRSFVIYRWVEIALLLTGLILLVLFRTQPGKVFWFGLGISLAIQSILMLGADYFAEKRALLYTRQLDAWIGGR